MRTIVRTLIALVLLLVALVVVVGPGDVVAGSENPFGIGPWSTIGRYCQNTYARAQFVDKWKDAETAELTPSQKVMLLANEKRLTNNGPQVPLADFAAFFRTSGHVSRTMKGEGLRINMWWDQNCTDPLMQAPASFSRAWSGVVSHTTFVHYPKDVIHVENFYKAIK